MNDDGEAASRAEDVPQVEQRTAAAAVAAAADDEQPWPLEERGLLDLFLGLVMLAVDRFRANALNINECVSKWLLSAAMLWNEDYWANPEQEEEGFGTTSLLPSAVHNRSWTWIFLLIIHAWPWQLEQ